MRTRSPTFRCSTPLPTARTRPTPSLPTMLGSEGRTGNAPWITYGSFILIGAYSTPTNTSPAAGPEGSARRQARDFHAVHQRHRSARHALAFFPMDSEAAEIDEVATGERPARLLQAATGRETAEGDRHEAETLDHPLGEFGWAR